MRVVFLGNARWSVPSLEALADSPHELALVVTRSPRPGGRGNRLIPTPVSQAALRLALPLEEVETVKAGTGFEVLAEAEPDVLVVVAYGEILPTALLDLPSVAPVNLHFSLLPKLRGAAPVQRALLAGLERTGVTTIRMDEGMDTGPILLQAEEAIRADEDAGSLGERLAVLGSRLLVQTLDGLAAGSIEEREQDHAAATYAPKIKPEERIIDWLRPADEVVRLVRAMAPEPGAITTFRGRILRTLRVSRGEDGWLAYAPPSGEALVFDGQLGVMTGRGWLKLEEVQLEGGRRMTGAEFLRGHPLLASERLGATSDANEPPR